MTTAKAQPPPPGVYVPAVLFFDEKEDLNRPAIEAHVIRLAQVNSRNNRAFSAKQLTAF